MNSKIFVAYFIASLAINAAEWLLEDMKTMYIWIFMIINLATWSLSTFLYFK